MFVNRILGTTHRTPRSVAIFQLGKSKETHTLDVKHLLRVQPP